MARKNAPTKFYEAAVRAEYQKSKGALEDICREVRFILVERLKVTDIKIHDIQDRVKSIDSILAKAAKRDCASPFSEIHDIAGLRIICLFRDDLPHLGNIIEANFQVISRDNKTEIADVLGYQSVHYICELPKTLRGARYDHILAKPFEIQIRTLCMHCWATVSHYIDYKGDWDVPTDLKKALNALSGLFYVADSEFQQFNSARLRSKSAAETSVPASKQTSSEINLDTVNAYLATNFPNRDKYSSSEISELILDIKKAGYTSISEIDRDVRRAKDGFREYEADTDEGCGYFNAVGALRASLTVASDTFWANHVQQQECDKDYMAKYRAMVS